MTGRIVVLLLAASLLGFAQGRPSGAGKPAGAGAAGGVGRPTDIGGRSSDVGGHRSEMGRPAEMGRSETKQALKQEQLEGGAWRMLQDKTGKGSEELQAMYEGSGARNFGQFASAVIVSKNLGLNTEQVLEGIKTKSLGETLKDMGVAPETAKAEIKKARKQAKEAGKASKS